MNRKNKTKATIPQQSNRQAGMQNQGLGETNSLASGPVVPDNQFQKGM